jgi:hypothetical protein
MSRLTGPKPWSLLLMITHLFFLIIPQIAPSLLPPPTRHTFTFLHPQSLPSHNDSYRAECYSSNEGGRFECHPAYRPSWFPVNEMPGPILEAARSKAWVCGRSLAGIAGANPAGNMDVCLLWEVVLSGSGLCVGLITHPDESYRVCVLLSVIRYNNNPPHLHWGGRRFESKNGSKATIKTRLLPSTSFPLHMALMILSFDARHT